MEKRSHQESSWIRSLAVGSHEVGLLGHGRVPRPASRARTMASERLGTPSLVRTFDTWLRTVLRLSTNVSAIWALDIPRAIRVRTSRSRSVRRGKVVGDLLWLGGFK